MPPSRDRSQKASGRGVVGTRTLTVAAIDPEPIFREGLNSIFNRSPGLRWVGHAASHHGSLQMCEQVRPDIVLIDSGFDPQCHLIRLLREGDSALIIIMLIRESQRTAQFLSTIVAAGVHGAVPRTVDPRRVAEVVRRTHADRRYIDSSLAPLIMKPKRQSVSSNGQEPDTAEHAQMPLTRREYQVLQLVAEGMENSAIAKVLYLSVETVRTHVKSILRKLAARDRTHAVSTAYRMGILITMSNEGMPHPPSSSGPASASGAPNTVSRA